MISEQIRNALNDQITQELNAAALYFQMSTWFDNKNYEGFASYLRRQAYEEANHAIKINDYILKQNESVELQGTDAPKSNWQSCEEIFAAIFEKEKQITALINNIVKLAMAEGDVATISFLQWFIDEQIDSERIALFNLSKIQMIQNDIAALLEFDEDLGEEAKESFTVTLWG